jgi:allantoinase
VLPGALDPHVHVNEPGRTHWEGFETASRALAAGGATAFLDMPLNSSPPTVDGEAFDRKLAAARAASAIDFALWGGLIPGNVDRLEELAGRGAVAIKAFMAPSGLDDFPAADDATLLEGMARCAELGLLVAVHAENAAITGELARRAVAAGTTGAREYLASRPVIAELEAIGRAIAFAGETGCALHVVHASTARGVELVARARADGVDATCETCPHYLLLTEDDAEALGPVAKCAPPLRSAAERDGLWRLLGAGAIPIVASDHSPCPPARKDGDFFDAWGGVAGCQTARQLLLARGLPPAAVAAVTATNPARRFRLAGKGELRAGADADLALLDLGRTWELRPDELRYRHRVSPFVGRRLRGRVVRTILRGRTVLEAGRLVAPPAGRLLTPAQGSGDQSTW